MSRLASSINVGQAASETGSLSVQIRFTLAAVSRLSTTRLRADRDELTLVVVPFLILQLQRLLATLNVAPIQFSTENDPLSKPVSSVCKGVPVQKGITCH